MKIPSSQFKLLMDSIVWAFKHTMRNVAEIGLNILLTLLQKFSRDQMGTQFFQTYFIDLMQHIFSVVTDSSHSASTYCALSGQHLTLSVPLHMAQPCGLHVHCICTYSNATCVDIVFICPTHTCTRDMSTCFDLQSTTFPSLPHLVYRILIFGMGIRGLVC